MKETKLYVLNKYNEELVLVETSPSTNKKKLPTVILVHGFGVDKSEWGMFDDLSEKLAISGFLVYRFDFSGRGESEGDYSKTSLTKQKSDLSEILDFVRSKSNVDKSRIGILAQSFGTAVTVALSPSVHTIILMGSVAHVKEIIGAKSKWKELNYGGLSKKIKSSGESIVIGPQFWKDLDNYNLLESIKKIKCPILFIHGSDDERVPLSEMRAYFENANKPKEKAVIDGANHGLNPKKDIVYKIVINWFKRNLE